MSPLNPRRRWSPFPEFAAHTIALSVLLVVVTQGASLHRFGSRSTRNYRGRVCGSNSVSGNSAGGSAKNKICALARAIRGSRLSSNRSSHLRRRNRRSNAAEIASVKQIRFAVFAQCKHQLRRRRAIDSDQHRTTAAKVGISVIELQPIRGRPVIGRVSAKDRPGLQTNNCFAAAPLASSIECVPCDHKHVRAAARDTTVAPNPAANRSGRPRNHIEGC